MGQQNKTQIDEYIEEIKALGFEHEVKQEHADKWNVFKHQERRAAFKMYVHGRMLYLENFREPGAHVVCKLDYEILKGDAQFRLTQMSSNLWIQTPNAEFALPVGVSKETYERM